MFGVLFVVAFAIASLLGLSIHYGTRTSVGQQLEQLQLVNEQSKPIDRSLWSSFAELWRGSGNNSSSCHSDLENQLDVVIPSRGISSVVVQAVSLPGPTSAPMCAPSGRGGGGSRPARNPRGRPTSSARVQAQNDFEAEKTAIQEEVLQLKSDLNKITAHYMKQIGRRIYHLEKQRLELIRKKYSVPSETAIAKDFGMKLKEYRGVQRWFSNFDEMCTELHVDPNEEFDFQELVERYDEKVQEEFRHASAFENASASVQKSERERIELGYKKLTERASAQEELDVAPYLEFLTDFQVEDILANVSGVRNQRMILDLIVKQMKAVARQELDEEILSKLQEHSVEPEDDEKAEVPPESANSTEFHSPAGSVPPGQQQGDGQGAPQVNTNEPQQQQQPQRISPRSLKLKYVQFGELIDLVEPLLSHQDLAMAIREVDTLISSASTRRSTRRFDIGALDLTDYSFLGSNSMEWGDVLHDDCEGYEMRVLDIIKAKI